MTYGSTHTTVAHLKNSNGLICPHHYHKIYKLSLLNKSSLYLTNFHDLSLFLSLTSSSAQRFDDLCRHEEIYRVGLYPHFDDLCRHEEIYRVGFGDEGVGVGLICRAGFDNEGLGVGCDFGD